MSAPYVFAGTVEGMTCEHCVASVTEELRELPGVAAVEVTLATGAITVTSDEPVPADAIRRAVDEAGYHLV